MKINWNSRLTNKAWWIGIISAVILLSQQIGLDLTQYIPKNYVDIINSIFAIAAMFGITVDTSTSGISDLQVAKQTENIINATNSDEKIKTESTTTAINNAVSENSASANVDVDNPDNVQAIGKTVTATGANKPQ